MFESGLVRIAHVVRVRSSHILDHLRQLSRLHYQLITPWIEPAELATGQLILQLI